jgi:hypothetical protein
VGPPADGRVIAPAGTARVQDLAWRLARVNATQALPWTRPVTRRENANVTVDARLVVSAKRVPIPRSAFASVLRD